MENRLKKSKIDIAQSTNTKLIIRKKRKNTNNDKITVSDSRNDDPSNDQ